MFLINVKSKGNLYFYLCAYNSKDQEKKFLFRFGRREKALMNLYSWRKDFRKTPSDLLELGCKREDLEVWIRILETGITKTGKPIKNII